MATQALSRPAGAETARFVSAACAVLLGFGLVLAVGFARVDAIHNAAHDARHSAGFPCH